MITIAILAKDNERTLLKTLESVKSFSEVLLIDTGSKDGTLSIAKTFPNVKIFEKSFTSFGALRNEAARLALHDWILALDSDEVLSPQLQREILSLPLDENVVYDIPFHNFYLGKRVRCCGWDPESHIRLYCRKRASFQEKHVHEALDHKNLKVKRLIHPIFHTPYLDQSDFLRKMQLYSDLFKKQNQGKKSSFKTALFHGAFAFFKSYILKRGLFYGETGFTLSLYNANTAFYKYLKLKE